MMLQKSIQTVVPQGSERCKPTATILIVDDDIVIRTLLANGLAANGYNVHTAANTVEMDLVRQRTSVDLILLDIMMPGEDGLSACHRIERDSGPAVILLSARGEEHDRITGLDMGAAHYLVKPCSLQEVLAHVRAGLRRRPSNENASTNLHFLGWRMNLASHELFDPNGILIDLTDGEFAVLRVFLESPRRVLSRDQLLAAARGRNTDSFDRAIDVQVSRLRRKLKCRGEEIIRTVRNEGYLLVPEVHSM